MISAVARRKFVQRRIAEARSGDRALRLSILAALTLVVACRPGAGTPAPTSAIDADIGFLTSPALDGRESGTPGADSAAEFLAERYQRLGLRPAFGGQYFQFFGVPRGLARNVGAVVDGSDPLVRTQFVVIGAHYDGLGRSPTFALDRDRGFVIRPGADDNASGTAGLLELARRFHERPARRSILVVDFDAEELGLLGSSVFLNDPPVPPQAMTFVLNLEMIGRLRESRLLVEGVRDRATRALIDSVLSTVRSRADFIANEGRSDQATFLTGGIDAIALSTGNHDDYHKTSDVAARIDVVGIERVVDVAERIIRRAADRR